MHYGLGVFTRFEEKNRKPGTDRTQIEQQIAQGGGSDAARDKVARDERRRKSLRLVGRRVAMKQLDDDLGIGRVAATKGTKSG